MQIGLKLNLGSGKNPQPGYINVDKYGEPDVRHDLEVFPWPWEDNSTSEIVMNHVLEHLGQSTNVYLGIMKELYRVCKPEAKMRITVPHPRHDNFINDPTHVRAITPESLMLFDKKRNQVQIDKGFPDTPLGLYLDIDFELIDTHWMLDPGSVLAQKLQNKEITETEVLREARPYNNSIMEIQMVLRVRK